MIRATFYDGKTSSGIPVEIHLEPEDRLRITGLERDLAYVLSEVSFSSRVGNTPRNIHLPEGATCVTSENDAIDAILRIRGRGKWQALAHTLESRFGYVLLFLFATIVAGWGLIDYGIPALAKRAAYALPASTQFFSQKDESKILDQALFLPSELEEERKDQLLEIFEIMAKQLSDEHAFRLEFRKSARGGPNAFAFPSGLILVTDELVLLAEHKNELMGVLAHEIGHVQHRHALRTALQESAVSLLIASVTGEMVSLTGVSAKLPNLLLEAKYSRSFETEADQFALQYLVEQNIEPTYFADILLRLEKATNEEGEVRNYLASHPMTSERISMLGKEP